MFFRDGDALAMRMELNDLRTSLKEEKWYSTELKKELDKLQQQLSNKIQAMHVPDARGGVKQCLVIYLKQYFANISNYRMKFRTIYNKSKRWKLERRWVLKN